MNGMRGISRDSRVVLELAENNVHREGYVSVSCCARVGWGVGGDSVYIKSSVFFAIDPCA